MRTARQSTRSDRARSRSLHIQKRHGPAGAIARFGQLPVPVWMFGRGGSGVAILREVPTRQSPAGRGGAAMTTIASRLEGVTSAPTADMSPCPCCNGEAEIRVPPSNLARSGLRCIECKRCGLATPFLSLGRARERWNRRPPVAATCGGGRHRWPAPYAEIPKEGAPCFCGSKNWRWEKR